MDDSSRIVASLVGLGLVSRKGVYARTGKAFAFIKIKKRVMSLSNHLSTTMHVMFRILS
jgi:hypothetical protein